MATKRTTKKAGEPKADAIEKTDVSSVASADGFVLKVDFESFKAQNAIAQNQIIDLLTELTSKKPETAQVIQPIGSTTSTKPILPPQNVAATMADAFSSGFLPPQYQKVFEKYFDPTDGFTARLTFPEVDEQGRETGGITFTIVVPLKLSNTDDGYRKMYKQDLRTRALQPHAISKGIEEWCAAVSRNLKYNKNLRTK